MGDHSDAEAQGQAPGSVGPGPTGYYLWWAKQPGLAAVPIGVYREPPPEDAGANIGAIFLGDEEDTFIAGFPAGYLAWRTTRAESWLRDKLGDLLP